jgi:hypothetical protein
MKSGIQYSFGVLFLLFAITGILFAQVSNFVVDPNTGGGGVRVSWTSGSESNVDHYEIYRRTGYSGPFTCVRGNISLLGDGHDYTIIDTYDLFKTNGTLFQYKMRVVYLNGSMWENSTPISASYNSTSSTAKRTWGSIKSMFR